MSRGVAVAVSAVVCAAGLAVAWFVPLAAVITVWPVLYLVPGWILLAWLAPRLPVSARLGLAIVISVAVSTHLVWWLAIATGGYSRATVFGATALLVLTVPVTAWRGGFGLRLRGLAGSLRREGGVWALTVGVVALVGGVLAVSLWRVVPGGVASGGSNWSDLPVHLSIAQSVNAGNFPPEVPYYAGVPLVYHWFADFHAAIAARAAGLFAVPAFIVGSAVMSGALVLVVHGLARRAFGPSAAGRRAAWFAAAVAVLGGGLGWIRLPLDMAAGSGSLLDLITQHGYDNQWLTEWPFFFVPSVLGTGLLVHRATAYGLPLAVAAVLLLVVAFPRRNRHEAGDRDRPALLLLAGLLGALLAPFHFFFFPVVPLLGLAWLLTSGRRPSAVALAVGWLAIPYLLALPFVVAPLTQALGAGALKLVIGWDMAPMKDGPAAVAFFYLTNLGIPFVLALAALLWGKPPWRAFLAVWVVGLFLIPNVVQFSGISFDMNKYFQLMWVAVGLLAGGPLSRWSPTLAGVTLAACLVSPLLAAAWTATSAYGVLSDDQLAAADWMAVNTPERSVFVTDGWLHAPTDPAGRLRLLTFTPYIGNLGYDPSERVAQVDEIYCGGDPAASAEAMRQVGASYVVDGPRPSPCLAPVDFAASGAFTQVYANGSLRIFHLSSSP